MTAIKDVSHENITVEYNGIRFGGPPAINNDPTMMPPTVGITMRPEYDRSGREVVAFVHDLTVQTVVYASDESTLTAYMKLVRNRLNQPRKKLKLKGLGVGFDKETITDIAWGPKPRGLNIAQVGSNIAMEIIWRCEFAVAPCDTTGSLAAGQFAAYSYQANYRYDQAGLATRSVSGYVQVAQSHLRDAGLPTDMVAARLNIPIPFNFRRVGHQLATGADKSTVEFSVTDTEFENEAFPPGITDASGSVNVGTEGVGFAKGGASLSMSLQVARNIPISHAALIFLQAALRFQASLKDLQRADKGLTVLPVGLQVGRQLYTRRCNFVMRWQLSGHLHNLLFASGIWAPVTEDDPERWRTSMAAVHSARGLSGLSDNVGDDYIINICDMQDHATISGVAAKPAEIASAEYQFSCEDIKAEQSWLSYDVRIVVIRQDPASIHRGQFQFVPFLPPSPGIEIPLNSHSIILPWPQNSPLPGADENEIEYHGPPRQLVLLQFKGLRVKFPIKVPVLETVGGHPVQKVYDAIIDPHNEVVADLGGCPVVYTRAATLYEVLGYAPSVKPHSKPTICNATTGSTKDL